MGGSSALDCYWLASSSASGFGHNNATATNCYSFSISGTTWTLANGAEFDIGAVKVLAGGSLLTALNAWVSATCSSMFFTWKAASDSSENGGYPIFDAAYVPATVPDAPTIGTATAGNAQASVAFSAPSSNGGMVITGYTVTSIPSGGTDSNAGTTGLTHIITGLTNGTAYTFTVTATNSAGTSSASAASNSITPQAQETTPTATFTATGPDTGTFSDIASGMKYQINSGSWTDITSSTNISLTGLSACTISVVQKGNGTTTTDSVAQTLTVTKAATPTTASKTDCTTATNNDGKLTGVTTAMEYKLSSASGWSNGTGGDITGLTNGTYNVRVKATGTVLASDNQNLNIEAFSGTQGTQPTATFTAPSNVASVIVGGTSQTAGTTASITNAEGRTVTTITLDIDKLNKIMDNAGSGATVIIPVTGGSDVAAGILNGEMVKNMETKASTLEIKTDSASYTLPASEINIDSVSQQFGQAVSLSDINVKIQIAKPSGEMTDVVIGAATAGGLTLVVPAVEYTISCTYGSQTINVSNFNSYVERTIAIPDGVAPAKITTGVVVDASGTVRHVPTKITLISGKYYAVINSLTNSTYTVIYNPVDFSDVTSHWAKSSIDDMGSRMVISGVGNNNYEPDRDITRAEFAAIFIRALGLTPGTGDKTFSDVANTDWYCPYIKTAAASGLITGYSDGSFAPNDKITREQAMTIIARAMKITKLGVTLTSSQSNALLVGYTDANDANDYAISGIASCLQSGIVNGRTATTLCPSGNITRAEVAVIVQRLLQKSNLI